MTKHTLENLCFKCINNYRKQEVAITEYEQYKMLDINVTNFDGLPHVRGTRVVTRDVLKTTLEYLLRQYPNLNKKQVLQALKFAINYEQNTLTGE